MTAATGTRRLTVYSRAGCHLCETMIAALPASWGGQALVVDVVDVDGDPRLARRYGARVPVLCEGEREICHYHLDPGALERALG